MANSAQKEHEDIVVTPITRDAIFVLGLPPTTILKMQQTERERADQPPIEGWKKDEHLAALKTIREMEVKISTLRTTTLNLPRALANMPISAPLNDTGLLSPPRSPSLQAAVNDYQLDLGSGPGRNDSALSPPRSPTLLALTGDQSEAELTRGAHGSTQSAYAAFEALANRAESLVHDLTETWKSDHFKESINHCEKRADSQELESGWELVVGRPRWETH